MSPNLRRDTPESRSSPDAGHPPQFVTLAGALLIESGAAPADSSCRNSLLLPQRRGDASVCCENHYALLRSCFSPQCCTAPGGATSPAPPASPLPPASTWTPVRHIHRSFRVAASLGMQQAPQCAAACWESIFRQNCQWPAKHSPHRLSFGSIFSSPASAARRLRRRPSTAGRAHASRRWRRRCPGIK